MDSLEVVKTEAITSCFLTAENLVTISNRTINLEYDNKLIYITPDIYKKKMDLWKDFRLTGKLPFDQYNKLNHDFYSFCAKTTYPFSFVTSYEVTQALRSGHYRPCSLSDAFNVKQVYFFQDHIYFTEIKHNSTLDDFNQLTYIKYCAGTMRVSRDLHPEIFEPLINKYSDIDYIDIIVGIKAFIKGEAYLEIYNSKNILLYESEHDVYNANGYPKSHLELIAEI